ncbi:MAG: hypothetical protein E7207_08275 [Clostridium butyricum]|nr:hypothetical protein [Clostridium butyricum]
MKRKLIIKLIAGGVLSTTLFTGMPLKAAGEWRQDSQGNYYFNEGDSFSSGWRKIDGKVYYFDENGVMQKGWVNYDDLWYFLDYDGTLRRGWINYNNNWYYSDSAGIMQKGVISINGKSYYFADNGVMQTRNLIINNQFYTIGSDGVIVGSRIPQAERVFDAYGNCIQSSYDYSKKLNVSPIESMNSQPMVDNSEVGDYAAPTRKFTVTFRDFNGQEIETKKVKEGNSVKAIDADSKEGYTFVEWNTKSDGTGKAYDEDDKIKVTADTNLYAIYKQDEEITLVNSITISGEKEVEVGKEIQLNAEIKPSNATNTSVKWSVVNGDGEATINSNGVIKGIKEGTVTVKAEAADKSGVSATEYKVKVVQAKTLAQKIEIQGGSSISEDGGKLQLTANIIPAKASETSVKWTIEGNGSKYASIDSNGVVTAIADGTIDVVAHAKDSSGIKSEKHTITITNQKLKPLYVVISEENNNNIVAIGKGTFKMVANVDKIGVAKQNVEWSVDNENIATIDSATGELTGKAKGTVTVTAKYKSGNAIATGNKKIKVVQPVESIIIKDKDTNSTSDLKINTNSGVLNLTADVKGKDGSEPDNNAIKWSVDKPDIAFIDASTGKLKALKNGNVTVTAEAKDGYGATTSAAVTVSDQNIAATEIKLTNITNGLSQDITNSDPLLLKIQKNTATEATAQIKASVSNNATDKKIVWSVISGARYIDAQIDEAKEDATITINAKSPTDRDDYVIIKATSNDGAVYVIKKIEIQKLLSSIQFKNNEINGIPDTTIEVKAMLHDSDASNKNIKWSVDAENGGQCGASIEVTDQPKICNENGVTISKQKIHLNNVGDVRVTASATDGSGVYTNNFIIHIKPKVNEIVIDGVPDTMNINDKVNLSAIVGPSDSVQDVQWEITSGMGKAQLITNGKNYSLLAKAAGSVTLRVKATDGSKTYSEVTINIVDPTPDNNSSTSDTSNSSGTGNV